MPSQEEQDQERREVGLDVESLIAETAMSEKANGITSSLTRLEKITAETTKKLQSLEALKDQLEKAATASVDATTSTTMSNPVSPPPRPLKRQTLAELNEGPRQPACIGRALI